MISDVFYPIFTLTITIVVCFIRKKSYLGYLHPRVHQGIVQDPLGDLQLPPDPQF